MQNFDNTLLQSDGGHLNLTRVWAKGLFRRMGYVKRMATTKASKTEADFESCKEQFLFDIESIIEIASIPD